MKTKRTTLAVLVAASLGLFSTAHAALVAQWDMREATSGSVAVGQIEDYAGANSDNVTAGGTWATFNGPPHDNSDGIGVQFDGSSFISFGSGSGSELELTGSLTVFARLKYMGTSGFQALVGRRGAGADANAANSWVLYNDGSDNVRFDVHNGTAFAGVNGGALTSGNYYDVAAVFDSAAQDAFLYVNGVLAASNLSVGFSTLNQTPGTALTVGGAFFGFNQVPSGTQFEQVRLYDQALSAGAVAELSAVTPEPSTVWLMGLGGLLVLRRVRGRR